MAILPIRVFGDPILRSVAAPVTEIDARIKKLVDDMIETMYDAPGVGLAAPQVGVGRRIFVFDIDDELGPRAVINPELVETSGECEYNEGCLSVPEYFWPILRPSTALVRGLDLDGKEVAFEGDELMGRVLQHEMDHLNGMLLLDRLNRGERRKALREIREAALG
ncbi:MAG: peptide deformylase [Acidimicrobiia bacterium]|nr:peptide deformylase [Acidimicrobiia bacterium]MXX46487.1 peptide deformylase [Acidimicrobiia bacterium]MXY73981.1 peptide deformylase [Acidimicrobiia bacterium]MYA40014.1 peptide deformylase [Acidimicrobiia bacterium]MYB79856.1 peptide deformylase [Acidimicrobiia bacterium]